MQDQEGILRSLEAGARKLIEQGEPRGEKVVRLCAEIAKTWDPALVEDLIKTLVEIDKDRPVKAGIKRATELLRFTHHPHQETLLQFVTRTWETASPATDAVITEFLQEHNLFEPEDVLKLSPEKAAELHAEFLIKLSLAAYDVILHDANSGEETS